jgi:UDP-GlcNAc:undecaprenyl-phosphate GlcNAc-1-phosphate transferase
MSFLIYTTIVATLLATVLVIALWPLAIRLQLVDKPSGRKVHEGDVPLIGGPVIWLVVFTGVILFIPIPPWSALAAATMLVILGMVDDRQPIPAIIKLIFHLSAASIVVLGEHLVISDIGIFPELFGSPKLAALHAALAIIAIAAAINAFNMIDGIDGLAASTALLALTHTNLSFNLILGSTPPDYAAFAVLFSGALAGFLLFNLQVFNGRKIFLGDSGSMLVGLMIGTALIGASQETTRFAGSPNIPATLCLWLIAIPITDMVSIIIRRLVSGRSPMAPDRTHLHHKIMEAGFSARRTLLVMILSSVGAFWIGYGLTLQFGEMASIIGFVIFVPSYYFAVQRIGVLIDVLK